MVNGHVRRGIGVVLSTDVFGQFLKGVRGQVLVALKHHVLEQMCEPTASIGIIFGPDVVPNLDSDRWTGMILDRVNLQTILQVGVIEDNFLISASGSRTRPEATKVKQAEKRTRSRPARTERKP